MKPSSWLLRSLVVYSTAVSIYSTEFDPLIFDPSTLEIYDLGQEKSNESTCSWCVAACPAKHETEKRFETIDSRFRSVFLQQVVKVLHPHQQDPWMKCDRGYQMAVLLHSTKDDQLVEFGFQGFLWLSKIEVRYNFSSRMLKSLRYIIRPIKKDQLKMTCHDHGLSGIWFNTDDNVNKLYQHDNQSLIFKKVKIPEGSCRSNNQLCVKQHNLVLPYQFQASSPDTISCSHFTTIPLWNEIPEALMHRLQMFLIALAQVLGKERELIVIPGVVGQLTLPSVKDNKPIKIYLNSEEKKVPVPKIIYTIVRHMTRKCEGNENQLGLCWFDVIIVIHNYPTFAEDERLCPIDECEELGWHSIQYLDLNKLGKQKLPFVYCCELNRITAKSIGFTKGKAENEILNLNKFPVSYDEQGRYHFKNITNLVEAEFKELCDVKGEEKQ